MIILELLCTAILEVKRDHIHIRAEAGERFEHPVRIERLPAKGAGNLLSQCTVPEHHWPWRVLRSHGMFHINPTNLRGAIHIVFQGSLQMTMVKRKAIYEYTCPTCGSAFTAYGNSHRKYCCHECYIADRFGGRT